GIARLEAGGDLLRAVRRPGGPALLALDAVLGHAGDEGVPLHTPELPDEPVELRLPATGAVDVQVVGSRVGDWVVELEVVGRAARQLLFQTARRVDGDGVARFEHVEVGQPLAAKAYPLDLEWAVTHTAFDGPRVAGERVAARIDVDGGAIALAGRLVGPEGAPTGLRFLIADATWFAMESPDDPSSDSDGYVAVDVGGRFELLLEAAEVAEPGRLSLRFGPADLGDRHATASAELATPIGPGRIDLGDVVLELLPPLARGHVVDPAGAPVAGVPISVVSVQPSGSYGLVDAPRSAGRSRSDGSFVFAGSLDGVDDEGGRFALLVTGGGHYQRDPVLFAPGDSDLVLVVEPYGAIAVRILVDKAFGQATVRTGFAGVRPVGGAGWTEWREVDEFEVVNLRAGEWAVQAAVSGEVVVGAVVEPITVGPGETVRDPRLDPLDLRGRVRTIEVAVVDREGRTVDGAVLRARAPGEAEGTWRMLGHGRTTVHTVLPAIDLDVRAGGYRAALCEGVRDDVTVVLEPPPTRRVLP
ncbi:MAG TPA: hypothetical protein VJP77_08255, partial [Planctomycetota bacterium]|nr:hypothetical protein [Planctomycetota bacterium]